MVCILRLSFDLLFGDEDVMVLSSPVRRFRAFIRLKIESKPVLLIRSKAPLKYPMTFHNYSADGDGKRSRASPAAQSLELVYILRHVSNWASSHSRRTAYRCKRHPCSGVAENVGCHHYTAHLAGEASSQVKLHWMHRTWNVRRHRSMEWI